MYRFGQAGIERNLGGQAVLILNDGAGRIIPREADLNRPLGFGVYSLMLTPEAEQKTAEFLSRANIEGSAEHQLLTEIFTAGLVVGKMLPK